MFASFNNANLLDPVYQPGRADGGGSHEEIAKLSHRIPLRTNAINYVDAATAQPNSSGDAGPDILDIGRIRVQTIPEFVRVKKSGRTTGSTYDVIIKLHT